MVINRQILSFSCLKGPGLQRGTQGGERQTSLSVLLWLKKPGGRGSRKKLAAIKHLLCCAQLWAQLEKDELYLGLAETK